LKLQTKLRCGMVERIENNYVLVTAVGLEVLRKQVSGAGTLGGCKDEGVPVGQLRGIRPMPGLLDQADGSVHGHPMRQVFHDLASPRWTGSERLLDGSAAVLARNPEVLPPRVFRAVHPRTLARLWSPSTGEQLAGAEIETGDAAVGVGSSVSFGKTGVDSAWRNW